MAKGATEPVTFDLLSPEEAANPVAFAVAEKVAQEWQALGLKVTHVAQAAAQPLAERLRSGDYVAAVLPPSLRADPRPYPLPPSSPTPSGGSHPSPGPRPDPGKTPPAA